MKATYLTIKDFAKYCKVTPQAIKYQIKIGNINPVIRFGIIVISTKTKYKPRKTNNHV